MYGFRAVDFVIFGEKDVYGRIGGDVVDVEYIIGPFEVSSEDVVDGDFSAVQVVDAPFFEARRFSVHEVESDEWQRQDETDGVE